MFYRAPQTERRRAAPEGSTTLRGVLGDNSRTTTLRARRVGYRLNFSSSPKATARAVRIFFLCRWESRDWSEAEIAQAKRRAYPDPRREWDNPTASHRPRKEWDEPLTTRPATTENNRQQPTPDARRLTQRRAFRGVSRKGGRPRNEVEVDGEFVILKICR